jgi:hypothetical protein
MIRIVAVKEIPLTPMQKAFAEIYAREGAPMYKALRMRLYDEGFFSPRMHAKTLLKGSRESLPAYQAAIKAGYSPSFAMHRASMLLRDGRIWRAIDAEVAAAMQPKRQRKPKLDREKIRNEARAAVERMLHPRRNERKRNHA